MVLIHGWGTDRRVLKPLFDHAQRLRRVVSVDLRGFGESDTLEHPQTIPGHADDIALLLAELGLNKPVIVGHSMGGAIALDVAARYGERVSAAVLLEALVMAPEASVAGLRQVLHGLRSDRYREVVAGLMKHIAGPHLCPEARAWLVSTATSCQKSVLVAAMEGLLAFDSAAAAAHVRCPLLYVGRGEPYADFERLRVLCPQLVIGQLVGCGHYFPLEVPEQLEPMVERFISTALAAG
jgi:pimeloyl-ACP methyl ester carboxylesterase